MFYRSPHNYDWVEASDAAAAAAGDAQYSGSLTVQSMAEDADINVLMKRFGITGQMPQSVRMPEYGDFTEVKDYFSAMQAVKKAQDQFMILPPDVRARFSNDPQRLLEFVSTPGNEAELRSLGLLNAPDRSVESGTDSSGGAG
jgi:phage internal scaffolding protein